MTIREIKEKDYQTIVEFCAMNNFPFPRFSDMIIMYVVEEGSELIAFGYMAKFVEFAAFPNNESKKNKVKALKLLNEQVSKDAKLLPISQIHVASLVPGFKKILQKIGYVPCKGDFLYLDINNE